jgi:hypothetical protein
VLLEFPNFKKRLAFAAQNEISFWVSPGEMLIFPYSICDELLTVSLGLGELYWIGVVISTKKVEWVARDKTIYAIAIRGQSISEWIRSCCLRVCLAGSAAGLKQGML